MNYHSLQSFIASTVRKVGAAAIAGTFVLGSAQLALASVKDSTGVEMNNGKLVIIHKVDPKETLYSISRRYNVAVGDIKTANPGVENGINIGQIIRIPTNRSALATGGPATPLASPAKTGVHVVAPQQTLYSIATMYKVSIEDLKKWNKLSGNEISIAQELIVTAPATKKADTPTPVQPGPAVVSEPRPIVNQEAPKQAVTQAAKTPDNQETILSSFPKLHKVEPSQTLYTIATMYSVSVDDLKQWNRLSTSDLSVGQELVVNEEAAKQLPNKTPIMLTSTTAPTQDTNRPTKPGSTVVNITGYDKVVETGLAEVIESNAESSKYMALHKTAPVGTILQVKNDMNGASVFVRVIGKLPETGANDKVVVRISRKAYERLNPIEKRFPVEVSYIP
jgi:LysM repeat protein